MPNQPTSCQSCFESCFAIESYLRYSDRAVQAYTGIVGKGDACVERTEALIAQQANQGGIKVPSNPPSTEAGPFHLADIADGLPRAIIAPITSNSPLGVESHT